MRARCLSLSLPLSHTLSLSHTHLHTLSLTHTLSLSHTHTLSLSHTHKLTHSLSLQGRRVPGVAPPPVLLSSSLLLSSLQLSDTTIYAPCIRALLGTASHFGSSRICAMFARQSPIPETRNLKAQGGLELTGDALNHSPYTLTPVTRHPTPYTLPQTPSALNRTPDRHPHPYSKRHTPSALKRTPYTLSSEANTIHHTPGWTRFRRCSN